MNPCNAAREAPRAALAAVWPQAVPFSEVCARARGRLAADAASPAADAATADAEVLGRELLRCYAQGLIELTLRPAGYAAVPGERPVAARVARWQAARDARVTSQRHESVDLDEPARHIVQLLDGTRDRAAVLAALREVPAWGDAGAPDAARVDTVLNQLARAALLEA